MLRAAILAVLLASQAQAGCETILATDSSKVAKSGDTMTGPLVFSGASSYVTAVSSINGQGIWGTFTGDLTGDVTGDCSGNAGTATALAANGANCSSGNAPLGVDASGAVEGCFDVATQAELDTHTSDTAAHSATDANTASRIVLRDASGNFSAGTITAALSGNATTATALAANGANCAAGSYPLGVDASGAVEGCTSVGASDVSQAGNNVFTSSNTFRGGIFSRQVVRGYVQFTATGTVTIQDSWNVTSITDGGVGIFTVNWTAAFEGVFYPCVCTAYEFTNNSNVVCTIRDQSASTLKINTRLDDGTAFDSAGVHVLCFGRQ